MAVVPESALEALLSASDDVARERAWAMLVRDHSRLVMHVARSFGGDYDAVLDRYEYVLSQLRRDEFRRLRAFAADGRGRFSTWLVVVARRMCVDQHRRRFGRAPEGAEPPAHSWAAQLRARRRLLTELTANDEEQQFDAGDEFAADRPVRECELFEALASALGTLTSEERLVLRLRFHDGATAKDIAAALGYPTQFHVYRHVNELCARLRLMLQRVGVEDAVP